MGHREDLLEGAKRCLLEKGWRTTARDIVAASGTNLASIGYHYGSKDALLREAMFSAMGDWADELAEALQASVPAEAGVQDRFEQGWAKAVEIFGKHHGLWQVQFEAVLSTDTDPTMREAFAKVQPEARAGMVALFSGAPEEEVSEDEKRVLGAFYMTLVGGLILQMAIDPTGVPKGEEMVEAMRRIVGASPGPRH